jgi:hypothetical protein
VVFALLYESDLAHHHQPDSFVHVAAHNFIAPPQTSQRKTAAAHQKTPRKNSTRGITNFTSAAGWKAACEQS